MSGSDERWGRQRTALTVHPATADGWTAVLGVVLVAVAGFELVTGRAHSWHVIDFALSPPLYIAGMAALFALCELALVHVEFRHEAYSVSLSGIPLVLGVLTGSPTNLVIARVVGALVA